MKPTLCFRNIVLLTVLSIVLLPVSSIRAQEQVFTDTFEDPDLPGWEHSPNAQVVDGVLRIEPDGYAIRPGEWGDLELNVIARRLGDNSALINYRVREGNDYALFVGSDEILLQRAGNSLGKHSMEPFPADEWFSIQVHLVGGNHEIMFNGQPVITANDPDPLPPGGIALATQGNSASEYEEISLISIGSSAPAEEPVPEPYEEQATPEVKAPSATVVGAPAYQSEPWVILGGPPGGLGYDIRMAHDNPDVMYVTDSGGGIFKSVDGGRTWVASNQGIEREPEIGTRVFCATIDPHDSNTIWVGTQISGHIYRSTNGGATWEQRDNGIIPTNEEHSVRGVTIDPNDANIIYAGFEDTYFTEGMSRSRGEVYKSTDAGLNWTRLWHGDNLARYVWIDPRNTQRLFVSTGIFDRTAANAGPGIDDKGGGVGILRSEDGGQTWTVLNERNGLTGGLYVSSLFMHPVNPDILIAAVSAHDGHGTVPGVYMTEDGGDTWRLIQPAAEDTGAQISMEAVEISEADPNVWYAAASEVIHRSDDGGKTWKYFPMKTPDRGSGFPIDIQVDPRDPYRLFVNGYGGGNMMSTDGGETWADASQGYSGAGIWGVFVSPANSATVTVSANTANFRSTDGGQTWQGLKIGPFEGDVITWDMRGRFISYIEGLGTHIIGTGGLNLGYVFHSTDGGNSWEPSKVVGIQEKMEKGELEDGLYVARAIAYAPSDPQTVYLGYGERFPLLGSYAERWRVTPGLFRSHDGGYTWEHIPDTPFSEVSILTLAVALDDPRTLYAATVAGVFRSQDGGDTWGRMETLEAITPSDPGGRIPPAFVILADPFASGVIYAGSNQGGVYRSKDGGDTWEPAGYGMDPNETINDMLPDPNRPGLIYASTKSSGAYYTTNGGDSWIPLNDGIGNMWVDQMALSQDGSVLYAGTRVSGVIRLGTPAVSPPGESAVQQPQEDTIGEAPEQEGGFSLPCLGNAFPLLLLGGVWFRRRRR